VELAALLLVGVLEPVELREMAESHRGMAPVAVVVEVAGVSRRRSRGIPCPKATGYLHPRRGGRARFVRDGARLDGDLPGRTRLGARIVRDAERHLIRAGLAFGGRPRKRPRYGVQFHAPQGLAGLAPPRVTRRISYVCFPAARPPAMLKRIAARVVETVAACGFSAAPSRATKATAISTTPSEIAARFSRSHAAGGHRSGRAI